jgi:hypothetical protein
MGHDKHKLIYLQQVDRSPLSETITYTTMQLNDIDRKQNERDIGDVE